MSVTRRMSQRAVLEVNGFGSPDGVIEIGRSLMIKCAARPEAQVPVSRRLIPRNSDILSIIAPLPSPTVGTTTLGTESPGGAGQTNNGYQMRSEESHLAAMSFPF